MKLSKKLKPIENGKLILICQCFIVTFCLSGFAWLCWGQIEKFFGRKTSVTVSWNKSQKLTLPIVVFCPLQSSDDYRNFPNFISEGRTIFIHRLSRNLLKKKNLDQILPYFKSFHFTLHQRVSFFWWFVIVFIPLEAKQLLSFLKRWP